MCCTCRCSISNNASHRIDLRHVVAASVAMVTELIVNFSSWQPAMWISTCRQSTVFNVASTATSTAYGFRYLYRGAPAIRRYRTVTPGLYLERPPTTAAAAAGRTTGVAMQELGRRSGTWWCRWWRSKAVTTHTHTLTACYYYCSWYYSTGARSAVIMFRAIYHRSACMPPAGAFDAGGRSVGRSKERL